jgi:hypothetical protein
MIGSASLGNASRIDASRGQATATAIPSPTSVAEFGEFDTRFPTGAPVHRSGVPAGTAPLPDRDALGAARWLRICPLFRTWSPYPDDLEPFPAQRTGQHHGCGGESLDGNAHFKLRRRGSGGTRGEHRGCGAVVLRRSGLPAICRRAGRSLARPSQFPSSRQHPPWRRPWGGARWRGWRRSGRRDRRGLRGGRRHRSWCSQRAECGRVPAAAIQRLLCAVHGLSEISGAAISRTRTELCPGAGLWTGPRLRPPAELSATGFVPASVTRCFPSGAAKPRPGARARLTVVYSAGSPAGTALRCGA